MKSLTTKDKIIKSGVELLEQTKSLENFTMKSVAEKAGFGKSTVYDYFVSKEQLLYQCFDTLFNNCLESMLDVDLNQSFSDLFINQINKIMEIQQKRRLLFKFIIEIVFETKSPYFEILNKYKIRFNDKINQRFIYIFNLLDQDFKKDLNPNYFKIIRSMVIGFILTSSEEDGVPDVNLLLECIIKILRK